MIVCNKFKSLFELVDIILLTYSLILKLCIIYVVLRTIHMWYIIIHLSYTNGNKLNNKKADAYGMPELIISCYEYYLNNCLNLCRHWR